MGAGTVAPLYGWVDPASHYPAAPEPQYTCDLSLPGGPTPQIASRRWKSFFSNPRVSCVTVDFYWVVRNYPESFPWLPNIYFHRHVPPLAHPAFFSSSRFTLNVTRRAMAAYGYCPSGRLFEAAACGTALISDTWPGIEEFFTPGEQIVFAHTAQDVLHALAMPDDQRNRMSQAAREHTLAHHTAAARVRTLEELCEQVRHRTIASEPALQEAR